MRRDAASAMPAPAKGRFVRIECVGACCSEWHVLPYCLENNPLRNDATLLLPASNHFDVAPHLQLDPHRLMGSIYR